jgi:hypothetical protein
LITVEIAKQGSLGPQDSIDGETNKKNKKETSDIDQQEK